MEGVEDERRWIENNSWTYNRDGFIVKKQMK
jgi:hypothetical protein